MNIFKKVMMGVMGFSLLAGTVSADEISELKNMMKQMSSQMAQMQARINELESKQSTQAEEIRAEVQEELDSKIGMDYVGRGNGEVGRGGLVVDNPFGFGNVTLGGYFDMEYKDLENTRSTFRQHRWILNVGAQVTDRLRFNSEYEIEYGGPDAPGGDGEAKVETAYVDYLINDAINFRTGIILSPFSRYNLYHDSDLQDLTDRPLVTRRISPTTWSEAGAGFFGEFEPSDDLDLLINYEAYVTNGLDDGFSDTGLRGARNSYKTDNNNNKALVGRLNISPTLGHDFAVTGYHGSYDGAGNDITGIGFDFLSNFGPLELVGEYAYFDVDEPVGADVTNELQGGYIQAGYHFWPEFLNGTWLGRDFEDPTFTLVGRYGWAQIEDDGDAGTGDNEETRTTIGINYRPTDSFVAKLEYQINETDNESLEAGDNDGIVASVAFGF